MSSMELERTWLAIFSKVSLGMLTYPEIVYVRFLSIEPAWDSYRVVQHDSKSHLLNHYGSSSISPHLIRINVNILSSLSHSISIFIPTQWLPHIKSILIILIIRHHPPIYRISHLFIQLLRHHVLGPNKQIDEPSIVGITLLFQCCGEERRVAQSSRRGRDCEGGDVAVPGEIVWVWIRLWVEGFDRGTVRGGFCFA